MASWDFAGNDVNSDWLARRQYPDADMTSSEFESFVADFFRADNDRLIFQGVVEHETIHSNDGSYDFDSTLRFEFMGMAFLVLIEAKRHTNPIKRELVQILHTKIQSTGAQKGVLVSTAPFQSGAIQYALKHGIALVKVTEGRFTYETKSINKSEPLSRREAWEWFRIPTYAGQFFFLTKDGNVGFGSAAIDSPNRLTELLGLGDSGP